MTRYELQEALGATSEDELREAWAWGGRRAKIKGRRLQRDVCPLRSTVHNEALESHRHISINTIFRFRFRAGHRTSSRVRRPVPRDTTANLASLRYLEAWPQARDGLVQAGGTGYESDEKHVQSKGI